MLYRVLNRKFNKNLHFPIQIGISLQTNRDFPIFVYKIIVVPLQYERLRERTAVRFTNVNLQLITITLIYKFKFRHYDKEKV